MSLPAGPWDPGLQVERTGLAWQRTMLSGLTCSLLIARLLAGESLLLAVILGLAALGCTAALGGVALARFRHSSVDLHLGRPLGGGFSPLFITAVVTTTGLGALLYVVLL